MLTYSVATNWDDNLIEEIRILDREHKVKEVFGKLAKDFVGGGRPTYVLPAVNKRKAANHIRAVKNAGRKFNYLLNASCLDNREFTRTGQKEIRKLLSWLDYLQVDAVTVANPYLGYLIKRQYPRFKLCVSVSAFTDSVRKSKFWVEEIGADRITLWETINRNFPLLRKIRSQVNCELQLLANQLCLYQCPYTIYHAAFVSHASQSQHSLKGFGIDWCLINCRYKLFSQPEEFIKATWIRPEDTGCYESTGINSFKIVDRMQDTRNLVLVLKAYLDRKFEGNLADFMLHINKVPRRQLFLKGLKFFFHPLHINVFKLGRLRNLFSNPGISVDNRKLDGFLDYFFENKCKFDNCQGCNYCRIVSERVVKIDAARKEKIRESYTGVIESITKGDLFRYF